MSTQKIRRSNQRERDEIANRLKKCREEHADHPAVLTLIGALEDIPITYDYNQLIRYIIDYFDQLHNMLKTVREKLKKKLGRIGFLLTNQTKISAFMTLVDPENFDDFYKEYATVECKFMFARGKYEVLELVTQFESGYTFDSDTYDNSSINWWVTDKLVLDSYDDNYSLNRAITTHKGFSDDILDVASDISNLFHIRSR